MLTSTAGKLNSGYHTAGFTLIELIVVISIISIVLFFSMPSFSHFLKVDDRKEQISDIVRLIEDLKKRAVQNSRVYFLHIEASNSRFWVTDSSMGVSAMDEARGNAAFLSDAVRFTGATFPGEGTLTDEFTIRFNPEGYSQFVMIHMIEEKKEITLKVEPILPKIQILKGYVTREECI